MSKLTLLCAASLTFLSIRASGEDFSVSRSRPLMRLSGKLQDSYGLLVNYEDAPTDPVTGTDREIHPNGVTFLFPRSNPITFHISSALPTREDANEPMSKTADPADALAAVQELVKQYNESSNPGKFSAVQDGEYIHIQQIARNVNGKLQPFEPFSNTVVTWDWKAGPCEQVLQDLVAGLQQQHEIGIAQGSVPVGALLMHQCQVGGKSLPVHQILDALLGGLDADNLTGTKAVSYTWELVYDPNWNKYFLNFPLVRHRDVQIVVQPTQPDSTRSGTGPNQPSLRLKGPAAPKP